MCLLVCLLVCLLFIGHTTFVHFAALPPSTPRAAKPSRAAPRASRGQACTARARARMAYNFSTKKSLRWCLSKTISRTRAHVAVYVTAEIFKKKGKRKPTCHFPSSVYSLPSLGVFTFRIEETSYLIFGRSRPIYITVKKAYPTTEPTVCFTTTHAFRKTPKKALPAVTKSYVIYQYTCSCAETYVGKTTQRLSERIKQHIPPNIATRKSNQADSAILAHIRNKPACVPTNAQERFRILARARSSYHLDILEAM